ncbi:MAG: hypothetical protein P4L74_06960, partial [Candidatus Doudnabacteria bacterium]|nr:hypothetical protein [Candidatus Doudnabacteria bacterium]
ILPIFLAAGLLVHPPLADITSSDNPRCIKSPVFPASGFVLLKIVNCYRTCKIPKTDKCAIIIDG